MAMYYGVKKYFMSSCNWNDEIQYCNENVFMNISVLFSPRLIDFEYS